jgi:hypothetical protein
MYLKITFAYIIIFYFSYGTPYLLSLDLSKELTALVWLAGPLSGLLVQPVKNNIYLSFHILIANNTSFSTS